MFSGLAAHGHHVYFGVNVSPCDFETANGLKEHLYLAGAG